MKTCWCGIDNGVTGSISFINEDPETGYYKTEFMLTPVISQLSYQKTKVKHMNRIDFPKLFGIMKEHKEWSDRMVIGIERPMINSTRFDASLSARASLEAMLIMFDMLEVPFTYIDSKSWQKMLLPPNLKGSPEQKKASMDVGCRLFPEHKELIIKHKDADGLLIGLYMKRLG